MAISGISTSVLAVFDIFSNLLTMSYPRYPTNPPVSGGKLASFGERRCAVEILNADSGSIPVGAPDGIVPSQIA